jgi:endonuclease/exonuclease/phosphatase family metal-dependent hydrolase
MNYWKERYGGSPKSPEQKNGWINISKKLIVNEEYFDMFVLQETSLDMLKDEKITLKHTDENIDIAAYNNKYYVYHTNPKKYHDWGLMIISKNCSSGCYRYNNELAFICYDYIFGGKKITVVNVHLQRDYRTKLYYPSLKAIIIEMQQIMNEKNDHPILFMGDFNASNRFSSRELENFIEAFSEIRKIGFFDCTEKIPLGHRSTMLDYSYQNDYIFINSVFKDNNFDINIRKDIETEYIDHCPIDLRIEL